MQAALATYSIGAALRECVDQEFPDMGPPPQVAGKVIIRPRTMNPQKNKLASDRDREFAQKGWSRKTAGDAIRMEELMRKLSARWLIATAACFAASPALAQNMQELLRKKYEIEQQRADAETKRAEAAATASASRQRQPSRTRSTSEPHQLTEGDPLENTDAQKCKLGGGATLRVSGSFRPSSSTKCQEPEVANETDGDAAPD